MRCFDVAVAGVGLIILAPFFLILALIIRLSSHGPAFFPSIRVGRYEQPFTLYKFRSMVEDAPALGPAITAAKDPRVTNVGRVMRQMKLDELPQLLNVLKGDMSLVGPRPEDPIYVALYSKAQREVLKARPGITSPASLQYRDESSQLTGKDWNDHYVREVMPAKLAIDSDYLKRRTVWSDMVVVLSTVLGPLLGRHGRR